MPTICRRRFARRTVNLQFRSAAQPPVSLIEQVAASDPTNPFHTPEYVRARESMGAHGCFIGLCEGNDVISGCIGFLSGSSIRRSLVIQSLPRVPNSEIFWQGLM